MSIQQSMNQIMSNLQWAGSFYSQSPEAKERFEGKQAVKRLKALNERTDPENIKKEHLKAYRDKFKNSTESDNEIIKKIKPELEADANKRWKMYESETYKHYLKYPTAENYSNYYQAKLGRQDGPMSFGSGKLYNKPDYTKQDFGDEEFMKEPENPIMTPEFSREAVLDGVGAEMINKIKQTEQFAGFREGLRNQELMDAWRVGYQGGGKK